MAELNIPGGQVSGFALITTSSPVVALQVAVNGTVLAPNDTRLATILADINASGDSTGAGFATTVLGSAYAGLFPGYDILIPETLIGDPYFAFDFSSTASDGTDPNSGSLGTVTVTSIASVPEPATAAGIVLGAGCLLLGRRQIGICRPV